MRYLISVLALTSLALLALPVRAEARPDHPRWQLVVEHLDYRTATQVVRTERHSYPLLRSTARPIGHSVRTIRESPHIVERVRWPLFEQPRPTGYQAVWEVTYYTDTGQMADGHYTHWGAAACGYDVAMFTRVNVPGVGVLVCEDHIGKNPWQHVDVWGYRPGLGNDYRTVTVYP